MKMEKEVHECYTFRPGEVFSLRDDEGAWYGYECGYCGAQVVTKSHYAPPVHLGIRSHVFAKHRG